VSFGLKTAYHFGAVLAGLAGLLLLLAASYIGQGPAIAQADEPVINHQYPEEGSTLKEPAFVLQLCFEEPVNVNDLDKGGDFRFSLTSPDNKGLGMRIVFQPDGYGLAIFPGRPIDESAVEGEWTWEYRVTDGAQPADAIEGEVKFSVSPSATDGEDIISATPPACVAEGATRPPTAPPASATQAGRDGPSGSVTPTPDGGEVTDEGDDSDVDILRLALLTNGAAGAAGVIALIGYVIRKRIKYEPHAPREGEGPPEHH
jgi:hypothetical protein